jgi:hypothetical protein
LGHAGTVPHMAGRVGGGGSQCLSSMSLPTLITIIITRHRVEKPLCCNVTYQSYLP